MISSVNISFHLSDLNVFSPLKKGPAAGSVWDEQLVCTAGVPCVTYLFSIVTARFNI